ncbi:ABC transporter ATP-binding protein [Waterburya agarophytonicola K14]|uniref:ABC transporter ATP-binding protein n=1 Tax=Waterburya agarophytonicola KI4 TaxID=2874699 RepID=A0A964FH77_9CYAN|nr:ABC transporter ATP-binding protein [Waterburya agarophytonicola]MCC0178797.1 ABC transporter ATP-binding protein [Waterburya agarophytonicola KI4]
MTETVLDVRHLQVQFTTESDPVVAVNDLSFQLRKGEKLGIVGESGSGKSVTSLAIMGLVPTPGHITAGKILFTPDNKSQVDLLQVNEAERRSYRGGEIAMIFQEPMSALNPVYDIGFQLTEAILLHQKVSSSEARRKAIALLQEVQLLSDDETLKQQYLRENPSSLHSDRAIADYINRHKQEILKRYPHQLSGGQLQRITIAMAISCNPRVLIADEPTTALDVTVQATILDLLRDLCQKRGMSLIFITHDLGVIAELVDTVTVMYRGNVVESGDIQTVFTNPAHPYTKGLLACRPTLKHKLKILPTVADFMEVSTTPEGEMKIVEKPTSLDQKLNEIVTDSAQQARLDKLVQQKPIMSVEKLRVGFPLKGVFGRTKKYMMAVNNVSFEVYPGETLGLVGESGCGKSTLARTLLRLIQPMEGNIVFDGDNITNLSLKSQKLRSLRRQMQIVFQNPYNSLNPRINIGKAIAEPLVVHKIKCDRQKKVAELLERVGLNPDMRNRYPHEFSGGQRQRVCIARALALEPQFIICDESVSALDVSVQAQVLNLLKKLQADFGLTYVFISHDLSVVKFMSDRIIVMNKGKIEEIDTAEEIYRNPKTDYTRKLINSIPTGEFLGTNNT